MMRKYLKEIYNQTTALPPVPAQSLPAGATAPRLPMGAVIFELPARAEKVKRKERETGKKREKERRK